MTPATLRAIADAADRAARNTEKKSYAASGPEFMHQLTRLALVPLHNFAVELRTTADELERAGGKT